MAVVRAILGRIAKPAGVIGIIALIAAGLVYVTQGDLTPLARGLLIVGGVGLLLWVWGSPATIEDFATARSTRYGSLSIIMSAAFIGILVLINFWVARHSPRWDITQDQLFSLAPQTTELLDRLNEPVKALAFIPGDDARRQRADDLLHEYAARNPNFTYEIVDPDLNPAAIERYGISSYGSVLFTGNNLTQTVAVIDESAFTGALLKLTSPLSQTVYFLTGHNERSIDSFGDNDYSKARRALEGEGYTVKALNLLTVTAVPEDAAALIAAHPRSVWQPEETALVSGYLDRGGSLLLLTDSGTPNPAPELLVRWGVTIRDGIVVDLESLLREDPTALIVGGPGYVFNDITEGLGASLFPLSTMITPTLPVTRGLVSRPILQTSPRSWFETDRSRIEFTPDTDVLGPVPLAVAAESDAPGVQQPSALEPGVHRRVQTRVAVFGDAQFAANNLIDRAPGNQDLFLNTVSWLTQADFRVTIRPKPPVERSLLMTQQQQLWLLLSSIVVLPGIVLVAGSLVWWGRR